MRSRESEDGARGTRETGRARAQLSVPLLEAALGILLLLSVAGAFAVGVPDPGAREARLDGYAADGLETLRDGDPSLDAFVRGETTGIETRLERLTPPGARYRLESDTQSVGAPVPAGVPRGRASTATANGTATLWVWYG